jgi:predicted small metal-binding protein
MMKFECKELGTHCPYVAEGNSLEEVKKNAIQHAQSVHKDLIAHMSAQQRADMDQTITRKTH